MEQTPTWLPDFDAWPQNPTQAPPQVVPQVPIPLPTQVPIQAPYQVPAAVTSQTLSQYSPQQVLTQARPQTGSYSTLQTQIWRTRQNAK